MAEAVVEMKITMVTNEQGQSRISVNGPIGDKFLCYAMLEGARDAVKDFKPGEHPSLVVPRPGVRLPPLNGGK